MICSRNTGSDSRWRPANEDLPVTSRLQFLQFYPVYYRSLRYYRVHLLEEGPSSGNSSGRGFENTKAYPCKPRGLSEFALRNDGVTGSSPVCGTMKSLDNLKYSISDTPVR